MIKKNDKVKTKIQNIGCNAEGVAKIDNQVVFIPYALEDEEVDITIINDKNKFLIGKINSIENKNINRITPPCPYYKKCGGCQLQHANYKHSLQIKTKIVQDAISNIGKLNYKVENCVGSESQYYYRNKISLPINHLTRKVGMYRLSSHSIIDIEHCMLQKDNINKLINVFNRYLEISKNTIYNEATKLGLLKHLVAREIDNSLLITVVINGEKLDDENLLIDLLKQNFDNFGLSININKLKNNVILGSEFKNLYGPENLQLEENDIKYQINNQSFLQINDNIKSAIYDKVFNETKNHVVIDAYSGAGLLSAMISKHATKVYGIEIIKPATDIANKLKKENNILNLTNINGDCTIELPKLLDKLPIEEKGNLCVVLDPPRKGCTKEVLNAIIKTEPKKIIYISCNPSTLSRDLNIINSFNLYNISYIQPYDMFPQTKHVETLCVLSIKK